MPFLRPPTISSPGSSPANDDLRSPEEIAEQRQRRRRWLMAGAVVALGSGSWFGARPTLHVLKAWQSRRTAAEAEKFMAERKWPEAQGKVQDALSLWRQEPAALRAANRGRCAAAVAPKAFFCRWPTHQHAAPRRPNRAPPTSLCASVQAASSQTRDPPVPPLAALCGSA